MDFQTERNDDAGDENERAESVQRPVGASADVVADSFSAAEEDKSGNGDVDGEHHGEDVGQPGVGIGPKPVRGAEFYGGPDGDEDEEVLPGARCGRLCGGEEREWEKNECGYGA